MNPEVQKLGQEEVDAVIGRDRAPTIEDLPSLPYVNAIAKEVLRWRPVSRLVSGQSQGLEDVVKEHNVLTISSFFRLGSTPLHLPR